MLLTFLWQLDNPGWYFIEFTIIWSLSCILWHVAFKVETNTVIQKENEPSKTEHALHVVFWCLIITNLKLGFYGGLWKAKADEEVWFNGESLMLIDMAAMAILALRQKQTKPSNLGIHLIFKLFLMVNILANLDRIPIELWKLQENKAAWQYQTRRSSTWSTPMLIYVEQNHISILLAALSIY